MLMMPPVEEPASYNFEDVYYWNHAALELNRLTHSIGGPQTGPTMSSRVLGILHLAIHDAYFAIKPAPPIQTCLQPGAADPLYRLPAVAGAADPRQAMAGAAITVLEAFYARRNVGSNFSRAVGDQLDQQLRLFVGGFVMLDALSPSYQFGADVATAVLNLLAVKPDEPGADQGSYRPKDGPYYFRDEPTNPVRLVPVDVNDPDGAKRAARIYHAPFYGMTAKRFAVQMEIGGVPTEHVIADPPRNESANTLAERAEYVDAVRDVIAMGGAPGLKGTLRRPDQTVGAYFWAYDGANLIGTPPRLYNQILRKVAFSKAPAGPANADTRTAQFVRLFALVNTAMADAGIFAWREKYCHEFWRPLPGVREHDHGSGPAYSGQPSSDRLSPLADPFWSTLGAPETNTEKVSFKPPFPAYPSGHATFGAAAFQMMRLYYKNRDGLDFDEDAADAISFDFVSEELNGRCRDLRQPYDPSKPIADQPGVVRTRVVRRFPSLWSAIFENAMSRIWLGVHWRFDAFAAADALIAVAPGGPSPYQLEPDGTTSYKDPSTIRYTTTGTRNGSGAYPIGGVPLGLGIAQDIFDAGLKFTPPDKQPAGRLKCGDDFVGGAGKATAPPATGPFSVTPKATQTNIR